MAWLVADSLDYYGAVADMARSVWDSATTSGFALGSTTTSSRFGTGQYLAASSSGGVLVKTLTTNEATLYLALAYYRPNALSGTAAEWYWQLRDGATAQCTVVFESSGNIVLKSGIQTGTVLATYTGAFAQDVWTHFQVRVVVDAAAGSMTVRKNGQATDTYASATNLNTRGGTTNSYANAIALGCGATPPLALRVDDVLVFSGSGAAPNTWVGDVRAVCLAPAADTAQKQFTPSGATAQVGTGVSTSGNATSGNTLYLGGPWSPARSGFLTKLTATYAGAPAASTQYAIYAADGPNGFAGTMLEASAVVVNPIVGANDYTFSGTLSLVQGRSYWLGWLHNAGSSLTTSASGASPQNRYFIARTYASGFPNPASISGMTGPTLASGPWANLTLAGNVANVSEALANGDTDYVFDSTVGDSDLYDMDDLPTTPASVIGVVSKIYVKKSDAATRQGQLLLSSGGTQVAGTDTVLGSTYTYLARVDTVDPATGVAWTPAAVNAVKIGQKVTA